MQLTKKLRNAEVWFKSFILNTSLKKENSLNDEKELKKAVSFLKRQKPNKIDNLVHSLHEKVFESIECLECAACCKTLGPAVKDMDIQRMARYLKIKPSVLTEKYLKIDEDGDFIFNTMPCPFLQNNNLCAVYESRPAACREYPHTDRKNFYQLIDLSVKNVKICPAVSDIFKRIAKI